MQKTFTFGKINYHGTRKDNLVTIDVELSNRGGEDTFTLDPITGKKMYTGKTPIYTELSIRGYIWNRPGTEIICAGRCLDEINKFREQLKDKELFDELHALWKNYNLNGMHAGTPEQEQAIEEWEAAGNLYDYKAACEMLKEKGLYEVNYTGLSVGRRWNNEPYRYGQGWLIRELPGDVLLRVGHMLNT